MTLEDIAAELYLPKHLLLFVSVSSLFETVITVIPCGHVLTSVQNVQDSAVDSAINVMRKHVLVIVLMTSHGIKLFDLT